MKTKINLPEGYRAFRQTASGRKGATRYEIYKGTERIYDNWIGDIVHFMPEDEYVSQPRDGNLGPNGEDGDFETGGSWAEVLLKLIAFHERKKL